MNEEKSTTARTVIQWALGAILEFAGNHMLKEKGKE